MTDYLKPKVSSPDLIRKHQNGQAIDPPTYMPFGGFTSSQKMFANSDNMKLERGGPQAKQGKPI